MVEKLKSETSKPAQVRPSVPQPPAIAIPAITRDLEQNEEWVVAKLDGRWQEVRMHEYPRIFSVPGFYEKLVYELLGCTSPEVVCGLLRDELKSQSRDAESLRVLDLGAGNGIVGEELRRLGVDKVVGADIHIEAAEACERDRPGVYADYVVGDITAPSDADLKRLKDHRFNAMTCVAALGFGDIPPDVFAATYNLVEDGGIVAFTIKDDFLTSEDPSGFAEFIGRLSSSGRMRVHVNHAYQHRRSLQGDPIQYHAIVATKLRDAPRDD